MTQEEKTRAEGKIGSIIENAIEEGIEKAWSQNGFLKDFKTGAGGALGYLIEELTGIYPRWGLRVKQINRANEASEDMKVKRTVIRNYLGGERNSFVLKINQYIITEDADWIWGVPTKFL